MLKPAANNLNPSPCDPFSVYDEYPELPTVIKQAEQGATARAMADFTRRTTRDVYKRQAPSHGPG